MPWTAKDAYSHTKKASTPALQAQWSTIANSHLAKTGDEAAAIRIANDAIDKTPTKKGPANARKGPPTISSIPPGGPPAKGMAASQSAPEPSISSQSMGGTTKGY